MSRVGLKIGLATTLLLLITVATMGTVGAQTVITRDLPASVTPGETFNVTLTISGLGNNFIGFVEQVPSGFTIVSVTSDHPGDFTYEIDNINNTITISATGDQNITYTLVAPTQTGDYSFSMSVEWGTATVLGDSHLVVSTQLITTTTVFTTPTPTETVTAPTLDKGPKSIPEINIDMIKLSDDEVSVGEELTIEVVWGYLSAETTTRRVVLIDWPTYEDVKSNIPKLIDEAYEIWTLPEDAGNAKYTYTPTEPGYYVVVVVTGTNVYDEQKLVFRATPPVAEKPSVSISVDKAEVVRGDVIKVEASMSTSAPISAIKVFVTGSGKLEMLCGPTEFEEEDQVYTLDKACGDDTWYVSIPADWPEGIYVAKIDVNYNNPATRAEAVATFKVVEVEITSVDVPDEHVKGKDLVITGTCNLAKSGTKSDNKTEAVENHATLEILDLNDNKVAGPFYSYIDEGGQFRFKIDYFGTDKGVTGDLDTGYYKAKIVVDSGVETDEEVAIFELVKPELTLTADKYTVTRGSKVTFTIDTNMKINSLVKFTVKDKDFMADTSGWTIDGDEAYKMFGVDVAGDVTVEIKVNPLAPLTTYEFEAEVPDTDVSATVTVEVVKQVLNISVDKTSVVRGGSIRVTGESTADRVFIYASDDNVFKVGDTPVIERPSKTKIDTSKYATAAMVPDTNDKLDFKIKVLDDADAGTYYLYFYAPANVSEIDRASDPQKAVAITVTDPRIVSVDVPAEIPYQGKAKVKVSTEVGDTDKAYVTFVLEGMNIKAGPSDFKLGWTDDYKKVDSDGNVSFDLNLRDYAEETGDTLSTGLYVLKVKLKYAGEVVDSATTTVPVEIVAPSLDVEVAPESPVVGDVITVNITTNRVGDSGYDGIWVTMVGPNFKSVQQASLNDEGIAEVTFETIGLAAAEYKIYVRDTQKTVKDIDENELAEKYYDLDPTSTYAKNYDADDDVLTWVTVKLSETAPTTPTETTTTVVTTTTPVTTTPVETTPVKTTPVETTPEKTPEKTPEEKPPIPGFEAIFAIAGLLAVAYLLRRK